MEKKIFLITIFFFGIFFFSFANAATLSISPENAKYEVGDTFVVKVLVSSNIPINAISSSLSFPSSILSIQSISKSNSILDFWVKEPSFSRSSGSIDFEGVTLGGFNNPSGSIVSINFKAIAEGSAKISFVSGQVLANDGQGTDVTHGMNSATYTIVPKTAIPKKEEKIEEEDIAQPKPSLDSPEILLVKKFGEKYIDGTSNYPDSQAIITFVSESGSKIFITTKTTERGEFSLSIPVSLKSGNYKVSAIVVRPDKTNTYTSNEINIKIGDFLSDISLEIRLLIIILILLIIYLIFRVVFFIKKNRKMKSLVIKEAKEAEDVVNRSFDKLNKDLSRSKKYFKDDLDEKQEMIIKEIKDIENL